MALEWNAIFVTRDLKTQYPKPAKNRVPNNDDLMKDDEGLKTGNGSSAHDLMERSA